MKYIQLLTLSLLFLSKISYSQTKDTTVNLNDCVVSGVRSTTEQPIIQKTISSSEIKETLQGQDIPVFISKTPSITYYTDGGNQNGYMYYRLRGLDQTRINTTLNGVPLNEPEDQGAYFSNYPDFLSNINSIQIIRGVGATSNGVSSYAGSMNFESPNLLDTTYKNIQLSTGSFNTQRISLGFNTGLLKNNFAFYGRYSKIVSDGYRHNSGTNGETFYFSGGYFGKNYFVKLTSFYGNSKNEMSYLASDLSDIEVDRKHNPLNNNEKDNFTQNLNILNLTTFDKYQTFSASIFYNKLDGNYDVFIQPDMLNFKLNSIYTGLLLNYNLSYKNFKLTTGVNLTEYNRQHRMSIEPFDDLYNNNGHKSEFGAHIKMTYKIKRFTPYIDIQNRNINFNYTPDKNYYIPNKNTSWSFVNPKVGFTYNIMKTLTIYSFIGQSWREPTRNDMFAGFDDMDTSNYNLIGDLNRVKPEMVIDYEFGLTYKKERVNISINYFDMNFKNEIAAIGQLSYIGLPLRKNVISSYRRGVEIDITIKPITQLSIGGNVTYMISKISEYTTDYDSITYKNVNPLLTPNIISNLFISYQFKRVMTQITGRYIGESYLDNTQNLNHKLPSATVLNFTTNIKLTKKMTTIVTLNNILNSKYYNSGYVNGPNNAYFVAPTRNLFVTFNYTF
jgi:iron complex outermembrane receptor protein